MLDELTKQVLVCGGVLSQVISHMVESQASGRSAPGCTQVSCSWSECCAEPPLSQPTGVSSNHSSYEAIVTSNWSKKPVSPSNPNEGAHGSQNQTGAVQV